MLAIAALLAVVLTVGGGPATAWGNGDPGSVEFPNFGIHDITCDIALRSASITSEETLTWLNDWYERNTTDWGYSFDRDSTRPTATDNVNSYTDDPDSYWKDWDNHTLYLHPRVGWDPVEWDAARRVAQLYNLTRDRIFWWLMNGSVRYDLDQHYAAYYAGLMSHYVMDVTQFGHTDWTTLDHTHPLDDPANATYHSYYEALAWTDRALRTCHVDLMKRPLPEFDRVSDPAQAVRDLAAFVNGRHGPDVQFQDTDGQTVVLGSTYVKMLDLFVANWDARTSHKGARGYDEELWNLTLDNLWAGMDNLTNLWSSAYLDAHDRFMETAADIVITNGFLSPSGPIYEGDVAGVGVEITNAGKWITPSFLVLGILDDVETSMRATLSLWGGETKTVGFSFPAEAGDHHLVIWADATQGTPESNETNNFWSIDFTVLPLPDAANLSADPVVLELLQEDTGRFNITLENLGSKLEVFDISLEAYPGTIDFSITIHDDRFAVERRSKREFHLDVTTFLENPVGPRTFTLVATSMNSSASINLTVIVKERQVAPFIEVEYGFFTNVSVPMTFDASGSWDHNGDEINFSWDFGDGSVGTGSIVQHAWDTEAVYVILLYVSDGLLHRSRTLEVSVQDAIPRGLHLEVTDVDFNAARFQWSVWNSSRYFDGYRLYISDQPDAHVILAPQNVVHTEDLSYVDNVTLRVQPGETWYVILVTVNIFGDSFPSNVVDVVPKLRTSSYGEGDPLRDSGIYATSNLSSYIKLTWREWQPLLEVPESPKYIPSLISTTEADGGAVPITVVVDVPYYGWGSNKYVFDDLASGGYEVWVDYQSGDDSLRVGPIHVDLDAMTWSSRLIRMPGQLTGVGGEPVSLTLEVLPVGVASGTLVVDWGDGTEPEERGYRSEDVSLFIVFDHVYSAEGNYTVLVTDDRGISILWTTSGWRYGPLYGPTGGISVTAAAHATISAPEEDPPPDDTQYYILAAALLIVIASIGVLTARLYQNRRSRGSGDEEGPGEEDEERGETKTAEQIVSELEEELGISEGAEDSGGGDEDEYFDHEPSVAELEAMIPRDPED